MNQKVIVCLSIVISLILLVLLYLEREGHTPLERAGRMYTIYEMEILASSFQQLAQEENKEMPTNIEDALQSLDNPEEKKRMSSLMKVEDFKKGFCKDYWKTPIHLIEKSSTEYRLISYGYNGKDDKGKKDDIVLTFNPLASDYKNKTVLFHDGNTNR